MDEDLHACAACGKVRVCVHAAREWRMRGALDAWRAVARLLAEHEQTSRLRAECASLLATERVARAHDAFVHGCARLDDDDLRV
jgi:hypothetical protein